MCSTQMIKSTYTIWSETLKGYLNVRRLIILQVLLKINVSLVGIQLAQDRGHWPQTRYRAIGFFQKQRVQIKAIAFRKPTLLLVYNMTGKRDCAGSCRRVLCRDSARRRSWQISAKGGA
jgi:hypothetical protein